ncbi:sortase [Candidatus Daviesbacteria bacterium]|nr:sortase [Candidatus Daviesbacteria bacterium]
MSKYYKIVLFIRFLGYLIFFIGLIGFIFILGPLVQAELNYRTDKILGIKRTLSGNIVTSQGTGGPSSFGNVSTAENIITPVSTDYGIVIEKINANAKIVPNVDPSDEKAYVAALTQGVAEARGSTSPGQPGNLYLFSHSTDAPWNIIRFNAIFYLLKELEVGDRVVIFRDNKRFDYVVFDKNIVSPSDTSYLTNRYDQPVLTLQTCDPPGTLLRRLVVRAKLVYN